MDSLTQLLTGAVIAAAIVPRRHRRAALAAGAALGTLPDLDVIPLNLLNDNPVIKMTVHRSVSHSLLLLPFVALLIWWFCRRQANSRTSEAPKRWFWAIFLALVTHPILDCFNVYGTWLFWPFGEQAIVWGNMFVIDPMFTLPLLLGALWALLWPQAWVSQKVLLGSLALSALYLAWSLAAQMYVWQKVDAQLSQMNLQDAPRLIGATPLNTVLWQVVVMTPEGLLSGDYSLLQDDANEPIAFVKVSSDVQALKAAEHWASVQRLRRFNQGFQIATVQNNRLIISDVRMGRYPNYTFNFVVGQWQNGQWQELAVPEQKQNRADVPQEWAYLQQRIWGVH